MTAHILLEDFRFVVREPYERSSISLTRYKQILARNENAEILLIGST